MNFKQYDIGNSLIGVVWVIFAILVILGSFSLEMGNLQNPGAGYFPLLLGTIFLIISLYYFISTVKNIRRGEKRLSLWREINLERIALTCGVLVVYGLILEQAGFLVTTFVCLFIIFGLTGTGKVSKVFILKVLIQALITTVAAYVLFVVALNCYFPEFQWGKLFNFIN
jgi:hypothetical protein